MNYLNALNKMIHDRKMILLYTDHVDKGKFSVGFPLVILNDEWIVLQAIDVHGFLDGYLIKKFDMIWKIETDDPYKDIMEVLFNFRNLNGQCKFEELSFENINSLLNVFSKIKHEVISVIDKCGKYFIGELVEFGKDNFSILEYDIYGNEGSKLNFEFDEVTSIKVRGIDEVDLNVVLDKSI